MIHTWKQALCDRLADIAWPGLGVAGELGQLPKQRFVYRLQYRVYIWACAVSWWEEERREGRIPLRVPSIYGLDDGFPPEFPR